MVEYYYYSDEEEEQEEIIDDFNVENYNEMLITETVFLFKHRIEKFCKEEGLKLFEFFDSNCFENLIKHILS